jgi:hypothetical protein
MYLYNCFRALPEQSLSGPNPAELITIIYCLIWDSPKLEYQVPVFISPRNRMPQLYPWALGYWLHSQSQSYIATDSLSWCQAPIWDPWPIFPFSLWLFLDSCGFVDVGHPLWRKVGSVVFSFCRSSPAQPFSYLSPVGLMSIFYCLYFWDSPNLEGQVRDFPLEQVAQLYPRALGRVTNLDR